MKWTEKMKLKLSKKFKGQHHSPKTEFKKGYISRFKNKKHKEKSKQKLRKEALKRLKDKKYKEKLTKQILKAQKKYLKNKKKLYKLCKYCGKEFIAGYKENRNSDKRKFCSKQCQYDNFRFDKKTHRKISRIVKNANVTHHIYGKKYKKTIVLTFSKHTRLHRNAYWYILEVYGKKGIDKYIKWFDKKSGLKKEDKQ